MPFRAADHLYNCKAAVSMMRAIAARGAAFGLVSRSILWDDLSHLFTTIGNGALDALDEIDALHVADQYNEAYLVLLAQAPELLAAEQVDLHEATIRDATEERLPVCRDFFDTIRAPLN